MTRREGGILAFAVATLVLAVLIAFGHPSLRPAADAHLPALNGPRATPSPVSPAEPSAAPSPNGSTPGVQAARPNLAMGPLETSEDEAEDEPASAEPASSRSTGSSSASSRGSGGLSLVPGVPHVPVPRIAGPGTVGFHPSVLSPI